MKKSFGIVVSILLSCMAAGQVNFFTEDEKDSLAANFYQRGHKLTALACGNLPSLQVGAMCFVHNTENRASYFVGVQSNGARRYVVEGEECHGEGVRQKEVAYTATTCNVGLARGFTRNWFIYGGVGMVVKHTHFTNGIIDNYRYRVPNNGVWFNLAAGAMYVADNRLSLLAGLDLYDRSVTLGVGYTW